MDANFDVIVVGAGHAGIEAAYVSAKMGSKTLLLTIDSSKTAIMPCNPSIGGLGKGHIVYEVSALGGLMPQLCTKTYLQARMLNTRKGPAVQGLRLQIDKYAYSAFAKQKLLETNNLTLLNCTVSNILVHEDQKKPTLKKIFGIQCNSGKKFFGKSVIITTGTFLNGIIHIGMKNEKGGRQDETAASKLTQSLETILNTKLARLKTGTPPRLLRSSINFSQLEHQKAHNLDYLFEFKQIKTEEKISCFIGYTNEKTHKIIHDNLERSALYGGNITGIGPRYCPSIEDKIGRYPNRTTHHIFMEPEGGDNSEVYPAGLSTSLPIEIQKAYIQSIKGLEKAIITKPGYAIEYDFLQPNNLDHTLQARTIKGLFFAGQINGTTGYEEAAGQGIIAGINATLKIRKQKPFVLSRTESYIGIMIDDIVSLGVDEPYRMFTSRAERRLLLRQDNVFLRLMPYGKKFGLIDQDIYSKFLEEKAIIENTINQIKKEKPNGPLFKTFHNIDFIDQLKTQPLKQIPPITKMSFDNYSPRALLSIHAEIRYDGYLEKEKKEVEKTKKYQNLKIPSSTEYKKLPGLTIELQEKLSYYKPKSIAQAQLIPGMTPAAISLLIFQIQILNKHS